jgi:hypothetical protein
MIAILPTSVLVVFNLVWYVLRRLGVRAFFPTKSPRTSGVSAGGDDNAIVAEELRSL